jgi:NADH-quinone oxidoreductase subunit L
MVFITFYGELKTPLGHPVGKSITAPLVILALLSVVGGFIELPHTLGHVEIFSDFLAPVLPSVVLQEGIETQEWMIQAISIVCALAGIGLAYYGYVKRPDLPARIKKAIPGVHYIWLTGWGFDTLYDTLLVRPFVYISNVNKADVVDKFFTTIVTLSEAIHGILSRTQSGMLRWYLVSIVVGTLLILTLGLLL